MSHRARLLIVALTALTLAVAGGIAAPAQEMTLPTERPPHPVVQRELTLERMRVEVAIDGSLARTTIRQTLRNDGAVMVEGKYMLPLPPGASVSDFAIIDGDTRLTPEVLPADEARRIYQEIVRTMRDPGLLEYQDHNTFSVNVFPFQPNSSRTIEVSYSQALAGTTELLSYNVPLRWASWSHVRDAEFVLSYSVSSDYDLGTISSPTHGVSVNRDGDRRASGSYEARVSDFGSDFVLNIGRRTGDFAASLMCFPGDSGDDGYFMLSLLAALPRNDTYIPKDVLFIFDKSGSMSGEKIEQARGGLRFVIDKLKPEDRFNLVYYSDNVEALYEGLSPANADNVQQARDFVAQLEADGGTDINSALAKGAELIGAADRGQRPQYVIFLTDGLPTVGDTDVDHIIANAKEQFGSLAKLFVFGVGYDVNTTLLDSLSYNHHGSATYVNPGEDIEVKVSQFYGKIASPALVGLELELSGLDEYDLMPKELPDLFHNNEIFITGRYRGSPARELGVRVTGAGDSGSKTLSTTIGGSVSETNHQVARLWATRKVSYLLDQLRLHGDNQELLGEIDRLAMRYGIVTPYTSYLITEPEMYFDERARADNLLGGVQVAREEDSGEMAVGRSKTNQANQQADVAAAPQAAGQTAGGGGADVWLDRAYVKYSPSWFGMYSSADPASSVNYVNNQTFVLQVGDAAEPKPQWVDARFVADAMDVVQLTAFGDEYFALLNDYPWLGEYLSQGESVVVVVGDDLALETTAAEVTNTADELDRLREALESGAQLSDAGAGGMPPTAGGSAAFSGRWLATGLAAAGLAGAVVLARREPKSA